MRTQKPKKPKKVRVVVEMHGGRIQTVRTDAQDLEVVFTEARKNLDGGEEFEVKGGNLDGEFVCFYATGCLRVEKKDVDAVFDAASARRNRAGRP